jgi:hypothetical protein
MERAPARFGPSTRAWLRGFGKGSVNAVLLQIRFPEFKTTFSFLIKPQGPSGGDPTKIAKGPQGSSSQLQRKKAIIPLWMMALKVFVAAFG